MNVSLIITTYNWPAALDMTFASVARQSLLPQEIIVTDDGSTSSTADVVAAWRSRLAIPVRHLWQEDNGFRVARCRNRAIAAARNDYIVQIDGDMILHPRCVEDHVTCAREDCFIQGVRVYLSPNATAARLAGRSTRIGLFSSGLQRRAYALRSPLLSRLTSKAGAKLGGIQSCNQSFWRRHALEVNGYDERFNEWGLEDREFAARLLHIGLLRNYVRHRAVAYHMHHATRASSGENPFEGLMAATLARRAIWCEQGINSHVDLLGCNSLKIAQTACVPESSHSPPSRSD